MAKYIKRKDAIRCFKASMAKDAYPETLKDRLAIAALSGAESIDIVRCKDCKWRDEAGCALLIVDDSDKPKDNDYCSYGERKDDTE